MTTTEPARASEPLESTRSVAASASRPNPALMLLLLNDAWDPTGKCVQASSVHKMAQDHKQKPWVFRILNRLCY